MGFHNLVNTRYFSEAAIDFRRNKGRYTLAPTGSREFREYWDMHEQRCMEGYKFGGLWIPGRHYFYLNFTPILKVDDAIGIKAFNERKNHRGQISNLTADRIMDFARFYEIDYEWYNFKNIAWAGGSFMGVHSPGAKHLCCGKTRGAGFSYKEASDGVYNFTFIEQSKSYYFAAQEPYLIKDGILNKVQPMLDWINDHIPVWKQNRQKKYALMHQRASYIDHEGVERGSMAEIIGQIVDDPDKTRGKRGKKIVFEEAGSFKNLKQALNVSMGSIKDTDIYVGQISLFGTGGEEGPDIEGLQEIYDDPGTFDMLEFPNVWEQGMEGTACGYFVPVWRTKSTFMDADGNVDIEGAIASEEVKRDIKAKARDPRVLDGYKAEYPMKPAEMFNRFTRNMFNAAECAAQIRRIETQTAIQSMIRYGYLLRDPISGVQFHPQPKNVARPIENYPHSRTDNLEGCVTIVAEPYRDRLGKVPAGVYQVIVDPYYKEESEDITSLCSVAVWKQYNQVDPVDEGLPVCWWEGRPEDLNTAYEIMFMMADYYNCTIQSEIAGGGQGIIDYAKPLHLMDRLEFEPLMLHNKEYMTKSQMQNRTIFMNMPTEKKRLGLTYAANWLTKPRGGSQITGQTILNVHRTYWIRMLKEMKSYKGQNADAISNCIIAQFMLKENAYREAEEQQTHNERDFYGRPLFGGDSAPQVSGFTRAY